MGIQILQFDVDLVQVLVLGEGGMRVVSTVPTRLFIAGPSLRDLVIDHEIVVIVRIETRPPFLKPFVIFLVIMLVLIAELFDLQIVEVHLDIWIDDYLVVFVVILLVSFLPLVTIICVCVYWV